MGIEFGLANVENDKEQLNKQQINNKFKRTKLMTKRLYPLENEKEKKVNQIKFEKYLICVKNDSLKIKSNLKKFPLPFFLKSKNNKIIFNDNETLKFVLEEP